MGVDDVPDQLVEPEFAEVAPFDQAEDSAADSTETDPLAFQTLLVERAELAEALSEHIDDDALLNEAAAVVLRADARLVDLLLPLSPVGGTPDRTGEDVRVDLFDAFVELQGSELVGWIRGVGVAENGAWLGVDVGGGPALDLQFGFGNAWSRESVLDNGAASNALAREVLPEIEGDTVHFRVDLADSARYEPGHAGAAVAMIKSFDDTIHDVGPAGVLGIPATESLEVLEALVAAGSVFDANLAVAIAVNFGALRSIVADDVVATVDADAVEWLQYGESLDTWLVEAGADWSFGELDALGKLTWAWPAAQAVAYGAFPLAAQREPLDAARYRFVVPDVATLVALRDGVELRENAGETATAIDASVWAKLRYRTHDDLMGTLCAAEEIDRASCRTWRFERGAGRDLGVVGGSVVALHEGVSSSLQVEILRDQGQYIGDCATATTLAINALQSIGLPAIAMGWSGTDLATPTHDVPLWYNGESFVGTQRGPPREWRKESAFVYVTLPGVHPENAFSLAREPNGWSRGGAVVGGWTTFREVEQILNQGLPSSVFGQWIDVQAAGGWPTW